ncbi:MAG: ribose 5-phosphate isomerase B [Sedimentisphaerales bacterium]|nr:ribose 5-phosphate isomerase B [Sedimentisphaerales bacterium]
MKIAIASDHRGYEAKELIKSLLKKTGHEVIDYGTSESKSCDYPDYALPACQAVASGEADNGILICGSGIGMSIVANKVKGIRAALCQDEMFVQTAREHNNANVLCLPAMLVNDSLLNRIVDSWLNTPFQGGRHERRVEKIIEIESNW